MILTTLHVLIAAMEKVGASANHQLLWTELTSPQRLGIVDAATLQEQLTAELATPEGNAASSCLGPCWELLDKRIRFLEDDADREPTSERAFFLVFDRLLDRAEGTAALLQQFDQWDRSAGRARYRVDLSVEPSDGPGALKANGTFQLRLAVPEDECDEWLAVYVLQRGPDGRWTPLFPNRWDHEVPWLVPGVEMRIPEAGACYELRAPRDRGPYLLKAIVTPRAIPFPVDYVRGVTRWTGRSPSPNTPLQEYLEMRRQAVSELCDLIRHTPGDVALAEATLDLS
jgi:Domain of unknown function (DUF4384)